MEHLSKYIHLNCLFLPGFEGYFVCSYEKDPDRARCACPTGNKHQWVGLEGFGVRGSAGDFVVTILCMKATLNCGQKKKTRYILCVANVSYHLTWKQSLTSVLCVQICLLTFIIIKRSAQKNFTFCPDWSKFELWHIVKRGLKVLLWQRSDLWEKWDFQNELASLRITLDSFLLKKIFFLITFF